MKLKEELEDVLATRITRSRFVAQDLIGLYEFGVKYGCTHLNIYLGRECRSEFIKREATGLSFDSDLKLIPFDLFKQIIATRSPMDEMSNMLMFQTLTKWANIEKEVTTAIEGVKYNEA